MKKEIILIKNSVSLYIMTFVRMIFPLLTLPYLTRILSYDSYGTMNYINAVMTYIRLIIDFGFLTSVTAKIAKYRANGKTVGVIIGNVIIAKIILTILAGFVLCILCICIPILRSNLGYVILSFIANAFSILLLDFFFQGIEEMHVLTIRFVVTQSIATVLTFVLVHGNEDLIRIPVLNIIATGIAAIISIYEVKVKYKIEISFSCITDILREMKVAFVYWISDVSSTVFTALNTFIIGVYLSASDIALWSIALQIIIVIQRLYSPITNSIYPYMVRELKFNLIIKILKIFLPLVFLGCISLWVLSGWVLQILGGEKYLAAIPILRALIPLLFVSFPALLLGWPVLGAIGKIKETGFTTFVAAVTQIICLVVLVFDRRFSVIAVANSRIVSEFVLLLSRLYFTYRNRYLFVDYKENR